jgi:hypothetical protein
MALLMWKLNWLQRGLSGMICSRCHRSKSHWAARNGACMRARTAHHHDNALIGLACLELMGKQLHAPSMEVRQYQAVELVSTDIHRHRRRMCTGASALLGKVDGLA